MKSRDFKVVCGVRSCYLDKGRPCFSHSENAFPVLDDVSFTLSLETVAPQEDKIFANQKAKIAENDEAH